MSIAFALPNGSIYVNTGLVASMEDEAGLAVVLAHEITHVEKRHSYRQNRSIRKKAVVMDIISAASSVAGYFPTGAAFGCSVAFGSTLSQVLVVASVYGYSRELESEADLEGYGRLTRAGYSGEAMARALALLDERLEFEPLEPFWRTHPKITARIAAAERQAQSAKAPNSGEGAKTDYLSNLAGVIRANVVFDMDSRRNRTRRSFAGDRSSHTTMTSRPSSAIAGWAALVPWGSSRRCRGENDFPRSVE